MIKLNVPAGSGPYHRFFVFEDSISFPEAFRQACLRKRDAKVVFPDDLLRYFNDFINWIPTTFFVNKSIVHATGLDYEGWSIIDKYGNERAVSIFKALISLLKCGPPQIILRGPFDEDQKDYIKLNIERQVLIELFENIIALIHDIGKNKYVLHLGV